MSPTPSNPEDDDVPMKVTADAARRFLVGRHLLAPARNGCYRPNSSRASSS
jgi:hypothetical protein